MDSVKQTLKTKSRPKKLSRVKRTRPPALISNGRKVGLLLSGTVIGSLAVIAIGVHIGANGEGKMYTGMVLWLAEFIQSLLVSA